MGISVGSRAVDEGLDTGFVGDIRLDAGRPPACRRHHLFDFAGGRGRSGVVEKHPAARNAKHPANRPADSPGATGNHYGTLDCFGHG